jgi:hypothetical protein
MDEFGSPPEDAEPREKTQGLPPAGEPGPRQAVRGTPSCHALGARAQRRRPRCRRLAGRAASSAASVRSSNSAE